MSENTFWPVYVLLVILLVGELVLWVSKPTIPEIKVPTAEEITSKIKIPANPEIDLTPITNVADDVAEIKAVVTEDDVWEEEAIALAEAEWSEREYKAIFNVLLDCDDREDISSVDVLDTEVTSLDAEEKDATIVQTLKVKYENEDGDNKKVKVEVTTVIEDGEIEDQDIDLL